MRFLSRPKLLYSTSSPYSGVINVWQRGMERVLEMGDYPQSVGLDAYDLENRVWSKVVAESMERVPDPKAILILGLGGGTEAHLFSERISGAAIDGVEIDPVVIEIGRKFFDLGKIPNLKIIVADAFAVIEAPENYPLRASKYGVIVVDTYVGDKLPQEVEEQRILTKIKKLLAPRGLAVFNCVSQASPRALKSVLEGVFAKVEEIGVSYGWGLPPGNILFFCS
jgi:spermidine synthase